MPGEVERTEFPRRGTVAKPSAIRNDDPVFWDVVWSHGAKRLRGFGQRPDDHTFFVRCLGTKLRKGQFRFLHTLAVSV